MTPSVRTFDPTKEDIAPLHSLFLKTVATAVPAYALTVKKFKSILSNPRAKVFVTSTNGSSEIAGFALALMIRSGSETNASGQHLKGAIALLIVNPSHQNLGIGSALHNEALDYLTKSVRESLSKSNPVPKEGSLQFGSIFPRIFPGIPDGPEFDHVTEWVKRKGWKFSDKVNSTDLYRTLPAGKPVDVSALTKKALDAGVTFRSGKPEDDEGLYALQKEAFDTFTGWPDAFPMLIKAGFRDDVWCAFGPDGSLIGATIAALPPAPGSNDPENPFHKDLALPSLIGKRCGAIGCVGISSKEQGHGAGTAMVATAMSNLAERGADGCFVDWVHLDGFYEKVGFEHWQRSYRESYRTV